MKLIKYSSPGWEKEYSDSEELRKELYSHICGMCRNGDEDERPVDESSSIYDLLGTPCGCEYGVEE